MEPQTYPMAELEEFGLPVCVINTLEDNGVLWLDQLLQYTQDDLQELSMFSTHRVNQIIDAVRAHRVAKGW